MLRGMTVRQFREWQAYFDVVKSGEDRADARAAYIVRALFNLQRDSSKTPDPHPLDLFVFDFKEQLKEVEKVPQTPEQKKAILLDALRRNAFIESNRPPDTIVK